jgi:hypothetical protein
MLDYTVIISHTQTMLHVHNSNVQEVWTDGHDVKRTAQNFEMAKILTHVVENDRVIDTIKPEGLYVFYSGFITERHGLVLW